MYSLFFKKYVFSKWINEFMISRNDYENDSLKFMEFFELFDVGIGIERF